jgi:hypothetical protein
MQFRLLTLLVVVSVTSILCALTFALPGFISIPALTVLLWLSPCVWVSGSIYARGPQKAFFIGGLVAGMAPFLGVALYSIAILFQFVQTASLGGNRAARAWRTLDGGYGVTVTALVLLSPLIVGLIGGGLGMLTRALLLPRATGAPALSERVS